MKQATGRDTAIGVTAFALALGTIGIESITPLGYAVWLLYFMAVCVTVFQNRPMLPLAVAALACVLLIVGYNIAPSSTNSAFSFVNRSIGGTCFVLTALVVMQAIRARRDAERALWLQEGANAVSVSLHGDLMPHELAESALGVLCAYIGAQVGALYRLDGERLVLAGGVALSPDVPRELPTREGQLGETLRLGQPRRVHGVDATHLPIASALGRSAPGELLMAPVSADGNWMGVVELGRVASSLRDGTALELLARCGEIIGVALRTSLLRGELLDLLEETQRQSEELQAQQEELRVANEELEEQSRSLQHSQANLEQQQAELEQTNVQLEERTHELEGQRQRLLNAQSELVRNSQELATASRYKSEFLANMSHELRTPLNSSLILAKLLADNRDGTLTAEQVKYAQAIHSSNNDLLALINDILDLSKIEAGHIELADDTLQTDSLLMRLRETFEPLARQKGLALDIATDPGAPTQFVADNQRLQQILKNLLANALKFTEHGSVSLKVQAHGPRRVRFVVCDTGIGIARDQTEVIFEAFRQADGSTRRRFGGTGLGLSISRDLALRMGGAISVESEPGRGSCFTLELPVDGAPAEAADKPLPAPVKTAPSSTQAERLPPGPPTQTVRATPTASSTDSVEDDRHQRNRPGRLILAVEDDIDFAHALVALAHDLDFDCVVAPTAEQALALAAELRPSGILLDIGLPDVSGLSVLERLKRDPATRLPDQASHARAPGQRDRAIGTDQRARHAPAADRRRRPGTAPEPAVAAGPRPAGDRRGRHDCRSHRATGRHHLRLHGHRPGVARRQRLRPTGTHGRARRGRLPAGDRLHRPRAHPRRRAAPAPLFQEHHHQGRAFARAPAGRGDPVPAQRGGVAPQPATAAAARSTPARRGARRPHRALGRGRRAQYLRPVQRARTARRHPGDRPQRPRGTRTPGRA
jgi:signal transduction histidine kinase